MSTTKKIPMRKCVGCQEMKNKKETLAQDGIRDGLVLELGCGTGTVTEMLADAG